MSRRSCALQCKGKDSCFVFVFFSLPKDEHVNLWLTHHHSSIIQTFVPFILLKTASQFSEFSAGIANRLLLKDGVQNT